jgi:CRISPR-associated protein Csb2
MRLTLATMGGLEIPAAVRRKDGSERRHAHAILVFDEFVVSSVLLGAGRYRGYGLCRPMKSAD